MEIHCFEITEAWVPFPPKNDDTSGMVFSQSPTLVRSCICKRIPLDYDYQLILLTVNAGFAQPSVNVRRAVRKAI